MAFNAPGRQFGYLIFYKSNLENLKNEFNQLEETRDTVQLLVDAAQRNGEVIRPDVKGWLERVYRRSIEAKSILEDEVEANKRCLNGWCPNLKSRYSLSRKARKKAQEVYELQGRGNFTTVSYTAPPPGIESINTEGTMDFESRRLIMNDVMEALKDDRFNMIRICGMGGVGKTAMVTKVAKGAKEENLFDEVVMAVVSQSPDERKIQGEMADKLGLKFVEESLSGRADRLRERLGSIKRILVILDDVWKRLKLNDIGIPFGDGHRGCKILLTSRSNDVCNDIVAQKKFTVPVLATNEAWNLFKEMAGISNDTTDMHSTQMAVANECGGLPIAIVTVARALNDRGKLSWDYALQQLRKSIVKNITIVEKEVFKSLELSYNFLESEEAKKFFLLCSLFPKDSSIQIEHLVRYVIGLELFEDIDTMDEARVKVYFFVDYLKRCHLLMDNEDKEFVKMHGIIRMVAISIASREEYSFFVRCDDPLKYWVEKDQHKNYAVISLRVRGVHGLSDNLEFRKLHFLQLEYMDNDKLLEAPGSLFDGMEELKVIALSKMLIQSLPTSLRFLTNLRTLLLINSQLFDNDISLIGALQNLEILSFAGSRGINELPKEIGRLSHLKLLDLMNCYVERIYPGVLSSLSKLEELYIGNSFISWEEVEEDKELTNASITELTSLSNLVVLDIQIIDSKLLEALWPRDFVPEKVMKFSITIGVESSTGSPSHLLPNLLVLHGLNMCDLMESALKMLLKITKTLQISEVKGLNNIVYDLDEDGLEHLTQLSLDDCSDLEYLIHNTIDGVLERAFPVLESLYLRNLHIFKGITSHDLQLPQDAFSALKELSLICLPEVTHLCLPEVTHLWTDLTELVSASETNNDIIIQPLFHNKVRQFFDLRN